METISEILERIKKQINAGCIVSVTSRLVPSDNEDIAYIDVDSNIKYDGPIYEALKEEIQKLKLSVLLVAEKAQLNIMNRILWECDNIKGLMYVDTAYEVEKNVTSKDRLLWDVQANKSETQASMSGWCNSYNNEEFTSEELEEYTENSRKKLLPYIDSKTKILEVGIGSGMLAFKIAPLCAQYDGCDISKYVLEKLADMSKDIESINMNLYPYSADEINRIDEKYDIILMSSVTEYFSGYNYMRCVIERCINQLSSKGVILFADVFDLDMKQEYKNSVYSYAKEHPGCRYKRDFSKELFIPRKYWTEMAKLYPQIKNVIISDKIGNIKNEINTFRYDVMFEVEKDDITPDKYMIGYQLL